MPNGRGRLALLVLCLTVFACTAAETAAREWQRPALSATRVTPSPSIGVKRARVTDKLVALTFDDGPDPRYTPLVLDFARKHQVPITFFLLGEHVRRYPALTRRIVAEGHAVGNHTWSHEVLLGLSQEEDVAEIEGGGAEIERVCGRRPTLFRPPKGKGDETLSQVAAKLGYEVVLWSVALEHHEAKTAHAMADRATRRVAPGAIILAHDGRQYKATSRDETILALPLLVDELRKKGYRFVTVPELLARAAEESLSRGGSQGKP